MRRKQQVASSQGWLVPPRASEKERKGTLTMTLTEAPPLRFTTLDRAMEPEKLSRISDPDTGGNMCAVVCFPIFVLGQTTVRSKYLSLLI